MSLLGQVGLEQGQHRGVTAIDDDMGAGRAQGTGHNGAQMAATARNKGGFAVQTEKMLRHFAGALAREPR